eukprot:scaffold30664_cov72-Phaeocystis_antarctica.AAC.5
MRDGGCSRMYWRLPPCALEAAAARSTKAAALRALALTACRRAGEVGSLEVGALRLRCHGTRYVYGTPEAGTITAYVQCVAPQGKPPCASGTYSTQEAGTRSPYVQYGGPGDARVSPAPSPCCRGTPCRSGSGRRTTDR